MKYPLVYSLILEYPGRSPHPPATSIYVTFAIPVISSYLLIVGEVFTGGYGCGIVGKGIGSFYAFFEEELGFVNVCS